MMDQLPTKDMAKMVFKEQEDHGIDFLTSNLRALRAEMKMDKADVIKSVLDRDLFIQKLYAGMSPTGIDGIQSAFQGMGLAENLDDDTDRPVELRGENLQLFNTLVDKGLRTIASVEAQTVGTGKDFELPTERIQAQLLTNEKIKDGVNSKRQISVALSQIGYAALLSEANARVRK